MATVYYLGGEDDYLSVVPTGNNYFIDALYFYSEEDPMDDDQWWHYDENGNMVKW